MDLIRRIFGKRRQETPTTDSVEDFPAPDEILKEAGQATLDTAETAKLEPVAPPLSFADGVTRPLPPETVVSPQNEHIVFGQSTDVGMIRNTNQDSALSFYFTSHSIEERPSFGLFVVADGMGGHHDGEKASAITTRAVALQVTSKIYLPLLNGDRDAQRSISDELVVAAKKANTDVMAHVTDGGTTLTAVAIVDNLAHIVHVGDSRAYLINNDGIEQITRDHSLVQRLIELDQITPEEAAVHPQKNVLYRALGQSEILEVDTLSRRLPPRSRLLLCSDGLWGHLEDQEIFQIVNDYANPQEACDKLVAIANNYGGADNITSILLQVPGD
jgi:serine/threonine protein phosphatase PrpC